MKSVLRVVACLAAIGAALPAAAAEKPPRGEYVVIDIRRASTAPGKVRDISLKRLKPGRTVRIGQKLDWLFGFSCKTWSASNAETPVLRDDDPNLSDTQVTTAHLDKSRPDHRQNRHLHLMCGDKRSSILQVDNMVIVAPSPSGQSYVILERRMPEKSAERIEREMKHMKFMSGKVTGQLRRNARVGAGYFASFLGAKHTFKASALTENMVEAMALHDLLPKAEAAK